MIKEIVISRPDDWHLHLRDGDFLPITVNETAKSFARAIIMPNLVPPVTKLTHVKNYKQRIIKALKPNMSFEPLMTLYMTEETNPKEIEEGFTKGLISAVKLYPAGATTNSGSGVRNFEKIQPNLEMMAKVGCPLCIHGEVTDNSIDIFDREKVFIDTILEKIRTKNPTLKVILEHITTEDAVEYVSSANENLARFSFAEETYSTASSVVMCSRITLRVGFLVLIFSKIVSINTFSRSKISMLLSVTSP